MHDFPEDIKGYLEILDISTRRLERFSYQALNISELQTRGSEVMKMKIFSLSDFLKDFIQQYREEKAVPEDTLLFDPGVTSVLIEADPGYLKKVLSIFVENALEHGAHQPVQLRLTKEKEKLVCLVLDHGPGFPETMLQESMHSYKPGIEHKDQKTGLNLRFAQIIMQHFKGEIQLSNAREGGAIVRMVFPVKN